MSKHYSKKRRLKYVFIALACTASFSLTGLVAACTPEDVDKDTEKTTSREDTQLLRNGNFEFFNVPSKKDGEPAPEYLINNPGNWTHNGSTSYTMSGIIGTSKGEWDKLTAENLAERLDVNNALDSSASDYKEKHVDFNGMKSSDLLYKDSYGALKFGTIKSETEDDVTRYYIGEGDNKAEIYYDGENDAYFYDEEHEKPISKELIANPGAHNISYDENKKPYYVNDKGERQDILLNAEDENDDSYYLAYDEEKKEYSQPVGHVLMLHNYSNSTHNGIAQNYQSIDISLPANTSAEISVWVKTADLLYSRGKYAIDDQDRGANITVSHTVGSSTLDDFAITGINTEKLIKNGAVEDKYNGWVEYTVYINACNFAASTVSLKLGLGESDRPVEGYAFFDDVTVAKYVDLDDENCTYSQYADTIAAQGARCDLTSDPSEKIFVADTFERTTGSENVKEDRFSKSFHYLLDLASEKQYHKTDLSAATAGLTVDGDGYTSALSNNLSGDVKFNTGFSALDTQGKVKLPDDLKNIKIDGVSGKGVDTREDLLALVNAGYKFKPANTVYSDKLNKALKNASELPNADESSDMIVLFSAKGAAYTASFDITVEEEGYQIISFWVKTSDMDGKTAATVKITEDGKKNNSSNVTLDTTDIVTDIDENNKDIYDGWVQCFFFVHNDTKKTDDTEPATLHIEFSFGNTSINGTSVTSYKAGWAALANMQTLKVDKDVFAYTGSGSYTASLTVTEDAAKTPSVFDDVYGNQTNEIENSIVNPSTYYGTNGSSTKVVYGSSSAYDEKNVNDFAGLINRDYENNYKGQDWYEALIRNFTSSTSALTSWNDVFGTNSVQPLIIVNKLRRYEALAQANEDNFKDYYVEVKDDGDYEIETQNGRRFKKVASTDTYSEDTEYYSIKNVINYGFIGNEKSVTADGYTTISVRVKVSADAVAYVYLVDTSNSAKVLGFNAPSYTYWYDEDGNVLKDKIDEDADRSEQLENVLYSLRSDGLYVDKDGNLRANTHNYTKLYNENITYYTPDGKTYTIDELVDGVTYYKNAQCGKKDEANHFLVTNGDVKVYQFYDGDYHYLVNGERQKEVVLPFETEYARYTYEGVSEEYMERIEDTHGEWVTVNFVVHAGSESKSYRLELWSGKRDEAVSSENTENGSVIFDYSYTSVSSNDLLVEYENEIIKSYKKILADANALKDISTSTENIGYYEKLIEENIKAGNITQEDIDKYEILKNYQAHYYTFSLYDSANFQPFNKDAAKENATGYDYSVNSYEESLAYLRVVDGNARTVFTDYSTIDQSITLDLGSDEDEDEDEEETTNDDVNVWLLASSIVLVVALIFAMIAILIKDTLKKTRRKKALGKNTYNTNKANRYIRKLGIKKEEIEEVDADSAETEKSDDDKTADEDVADDKAVDEDVKEQPAEENTETVEPEDNSEDGQE